MVGFAFISDFELGCVFVENYAADWVSKHYFSLNLMEESTFCLLWLVVQKKLWIGESTSEAADAISSILVLVRALMLLKSESSP